MNGPLVNTVKCSDLQGLTTVGMSICPFDFYIVKTLTHFRSIFIDLEPKSQIH